MRPKRTEKYVERADDVVDEVDRDFVLQKTPTTWAGVLCVLGGSTPFCPRKATKP